MSRTSEVQLTETALKIYVHLLETNQPKSVREIARELNISPSTVSYYLKKFGEMGIIKDIGTGYIIAKKIDIEDFIYIGNRLIPKFFIYTSFFLGLIVGEIFVVLKSSSITPHTILSLLSATIASFLFLYEGIKMRRRLVK